MSGPDVDMEWSACVQTVKHRSPESLVARQVHPADSRYGIDSLAWSADGRRLASASLLVMQAQDEAAQDAEDTLIRLGCTINLFDIIEGVRIFVLSFDGSRIGQICLPEDGWGLASTDQGILVATKEVAQRWKPSALEAEREDFERHPGVISWKFVEVLDAATGATLSKFEFGPDVHRLTLSANGEWAAATEYCGDNESGPVGTAQIWNVKAGTCRGSFKVNHGHSLSEALSADGQRFLTVEETDTMSPGNSFLWDTTTGTCLKVFKSSRAAACLLSEDGQRGAFMVQGADMAQYQVHNLGTADGACQTLLIDDEAEPSQRFMSLSADGQRLAVSNRGSVPAIEVWDVATDSITQVAKCGEKRMDLSAFSPNGQRLASTMTNQKFIQIWDLTANLPQEDSSVDMSGRQATSTSHVTPALRKRPTDDDSITVLSADGHWISTFHSGPSSLAVMDAQTGEVLRDFENFESTGRELVRAHLSADGRRMAFSEGKTSVDDERVRICDVATGCTLAVFPVDCLVHTLILSSDGRWLTAQVSNRVAVWDVDGGTLRGMATLEAEAAKERFLTGISTDGRRVVGHDGRGEVAVMELEKDVYVETARFQSHAPLSPDAVFYTLFEVTSRDCRRLALWSSRAKKVNIWDLDKSVLLQTLTIEAPGMLHRVAFVGQSNSVLRTNLGSWNLECPDATSAKQKGDSVASDACVAGYGISGDGEWIVKDAERLLWIPLEYRPDSYMVHESTIDFQGRDVVAYTIGLGPS